MKILLKDCRIITQERKTTERNHILIEDGIIKKISSVPITTPCDKTITSDDLCVSIGWFDFRADFCEPGTEHKENIQSGLNAAAAGGFTGVLLSASTTPSIDSNSQVEFLVNRHQQHIVKLYPTGTITEKREGKKLAELYDMKLSGALAFSDGKRSIKDAGLFMRALQYAKGIDTLVMNYPYDSSLAAGGKVNEGVYSTRLGLKGIPSIAEELMIARDISLLEYTGGRSHVSTISTAKSVELIREAKKKGLNISCDVAAHQLLLNDSNLEQFDTNYKVMPPLRSEEDVKALRKGVLDGTIDIICSDHTPQDIESKLKEFETAEYGISGIQSFFSTICSSFDTMDSNEIFQAFTSGPRTILGLAIPQIKENAEAELTIFDPSKTTEYSNVNWLSKSKNNPFINKEMKGKVIGLINGKNKSAFFI